MTKHSEDTWEARWLMVGWAFCSGLSYEDTAKVMGGSCEGLKIAMKRKKKTRVTLQREFLRSHKIRPMSIVKATQ